MKKISLLALVLVVGLPGCGPKQEKAQSVKRNNIEKYAEMPDEDEVEEIIATTDEDDAGDEVDLSLDEEEDEDFDVDNLFGDEDEEVSEEDMDEEEIDEEAFNWIDVQADDEFKKLYFTFNHYGIKADQKEALNHNIDQVKQLIAESGSTQLTLLVEGHACQEGAPAYNVGLSEKRAKSVADLFVAAGVNRNLIKVVGRGQEYPETINGKIVNGSREDRALNRRVEIRVIYT
jgi:outer membrane protein OmpA-like peptidoglycan-associated protein